MKENRLLGNFTVVASLLTGLVYSLLFYNQQAVGIGFFYFYLLLIVIGQVGKYIKNNKLNFSKSDLIYIPLLLLSLVPALSQNQSIGFFSVVLSTFGFYVITIFSSWSISISNFGIFNNFILSLYQFVSGFLGLNLLRKSLAKLDGNKPKSNILIKILLGSLIALPCVFVYIILFSSSDQVFGKIFENILNTFSRGDIFGILAVTLFVAVFAIFNFASYFFTKYDQQKNPLVKIKVIFDEVILLTFSIIINVVFTIFVVTQFIYLFGNRDITVSLGIVYSDYARRGFMEMVLASLISIGLIVGTKMLINNTNKKLSVAFNISLILSSIFNLVILFSAFKRLDLYVSGYGLSELRLYIYTTILFIALLFIFFIVGLIIDTVKSIQGNFEFSLIKQSLLIACLIAVVELFGLGVLNPDALITKVNIQRESILQTSTEKIYQETVDIDYLINNLSSDAYPQILDQKLIKLYDIQYCTMAYRWAQENTVRNNLSSLNLYKQFNDKKISEGLKDYLVENKLDKDKCNGLVNFSTQYNYGLDNYSNFLDYQVDAEFDKPLEYTFPNIKKVYLLNQGYLVDVTVNENKLTWTPKIEDINQTYYLNFESDNNEYITLTVNVVYPFDIKNISVGPFGTMQVTQVERLVDGNASYPDLAVVNTKQTQLGYEFNKTKTIKGFKVSVSGEKDGNKSYLWTIKNADDKTIVSNYETKIINEFTTIDLESICKDNLDCKSNKFTLDIKRNNGDGVVHIMEIDPILED